MKVLAAAIVVSCGLVWMGCGGDDVITDGETACTSDAGCASFSCPTGQAPFCDTDTAACDCAEDTNGGTGGTGGTVTPVTCDEPTGTITGTALDEQDPQQPIPMMRITAVPQPSGPSVTERSDTNGMFTLQVCAGATYAMSAETVVDMQRYVSTDSSDRVDVPDDSPVTYNIDARRGYFLDATSASGDTITASPDEEVSLDINTRAWSREECLECTYRIAVGIEGDFADWDEIGAGSYAFNGNGPSIALATVTLTAPSMVGDYEVYALIYAGTATTEAAETFYEGEDGMRFPNTDKYIRLATLRVE